ncbi:MAG: tail fiber domain-containing protein [Deltaproteobacteria bacterium]
MNEKCGGTKVWMVRLLFGMIIISLCIAIPVYAPCADKLLVKNASGTTTFKVEDNGSVSAASRLLANGASAWGSAPFVLGQDVLNRGIVITDKASVNQKNIYFGWNVGSSHEYAEIFALQEGIAYKNVVLNPSGGFVGIGMTNPAHPLQMGSGAYVSAGGVWTNASSREYKQDISELGYDEAMDALKVLNPVKFRYKADPREGHVGFIAEDAPEIVASQDKKGMSAMDVVALLTKVVQEQQKTIERLSGKIAKLERQGK